MNRWLRTGLNLTIITLPLLFFGLFYFYPLASIFQLSFSWESEQPLWQTVTQPFYLQTFWFTFWQAVVSTTLTILLAFPGAYVFARYHFWGKQTIKAIITLPFVLPTVVVANAFTALLGPSGLLNDWLTTLFMLDAPPIQLQNSIWLILLAHVFYNYSVALRMISGFWQNLDPNLPQAAQMLGLSPRRAFWQITWPLLAPAVGATAVLIFLFTFTSFGVILLLGGAGFATLEVEIYQQAVKLFNLPVAATLSLLQILFTFTLMWFYTHIQTKLARSLTLHRKQTLAIRNWQDRVIVFSNIGLMACLLGLPLLALLTRSFTGQNGFTTRFYRQLFINERDSIFFVPPIEAITNSTGFALVTVIMSLIIGLAIVWLLTLTTESAEGAEKENSLISNSLLAKIRSILDPLFMLPLATSAVTLGFGYIITLNEPPLNLRSSIVLVPIAHTLVAVPFVVRTVLPAMRRVDNSLREAASMLGATPHRVRREIDWPLIRQAVLVGAVFAFTMSMGEFGATLFIARPQTPTMPVAIFRFLGQPGALNYGQALAMSSLLMLVCTLGFIAIERFRLGDEGEF